MPQARASAVYISAAANRHNHASDVSSESLVVFGSSKLVAIWDAADVHDRGVVETLPGHDGLVTGVQFVRDDLFASADDKGSIKWWKKNGAQWVSTGGLQAHSKAISSLCILGNLFVTGGSDAVVKIWRFNDHFDTLEELQIIPLKGKYPLSVALAYLPGSKAIILAIASTDRNVQILTRSDDVFVPSAALSGHEDWVRSLSFRVSASETDPLVLASGSQDGTIRLWNVELLSRDIKALQIQSREPLSDQLLDDFEASLGDLADAEEGGRQISLKRHILTVKTEHGKAQQFSITFDALLVGHEAGITSLSWRPDPASLSIPTLLSTSTDSSLILWSPSTVITLETESSSIWINRQRFGDIGGQRLGGFVGGLWARHGNEVMAWGWAGGWRRWKCQNIDNEVGDEEWSEIGAIGGHNGPVKGIDWSPKGGYLISAGLDQTTRIHGAVPFKSENENMCSWHELSRPQVHGYDLIDVTFLNALRFISIADEKVARVFEAPRGFVQVINGLGVAETMLDERERPLGASVPPLGLSNKATGEVTLESNPASSQNGVNKTVRRPFEGELASMTLWPETEKVFGHGYESISLAVSYSKRLIATSCKATTAEHAVVRVYDTEKWQLFGQPLEGHTLTVTRIAFSYDERYILSVSRDRTWRLFENQIDHGYIPMAADKSHARIIWDCTWAHEGDVFVTASRDKTVKIWNLKDRDNGKKWTPIASIKVTEAATAVALASTDTDGRRRLAVGLETGEIMIYSNIATSISSWELEQAIDSRVAHVDHINRLSWQPNDNISYKRLATCSEDGTLKVLIVHVGVD